VGAREWMGGVALLAGALAGCGGGDPDAGVLRGRGMTPAGLAPAAEARVAEAAVGAAFEREPGLNFLLNPRRLARTAEDSGAAAVAPAVVEALRARRVIGGTCEPRAEAERDTPRCPGDRTGYVLRLSDVYRDRGDTVQLYLAAERYAPEAGAKPEALRLEKVYRMVQAGDRWRVVGEARSPGDAP